MKKILICALTLLSGCASYEWKNSNPNAIEIDEAIYKCAQEAVQAYPDPIMPQTYVIDHVRRYRGYTKAEEAEIRMDERRARQAADNIYWKKHLQTGYNQSSYEGKCLAGLGWKRIEIKE